MLSSPDFLQAYLMPHIHFFIIFVLSSTYPLSFNALCSPIAKRAIQLQLLQKKVKRTNRESKTVHTPAPMVSPFRRNRTRPMSLLAENVSSGIEMGLAVGETEVEVDRSCISTRAEEFFVKTRGFVLITAPEARSIDSMNLLIIAGVSREWWNSSICGHQ